MVLNRCAPAPVYPPPRHYVCRGGLTRTPKSPLGVYKRRGLRSNGYTNLVHAPVNGAPILTRRNEMSNYQEGGAGYGEGTHTGGASYEEAPPGGATAAAPSPAHSGGGQF